ncbi:ISL3 family transposase [Exiguobacterium aurantiacum]|uniref:Transposase and inactivated derivatives n=1 Tax=Exiguobacterium aurantiacum TaxID=33987 RepID=A0A377FWL9_9BACL|nr:ISL3 family transposase [Exiguobacterium aurantiacum]STO08964.1 Transposase and inactivated derivatives [Exiguobacterium aurantiacum]
MSQQFIKLILPLPPFFQIEAPSDEEPHVFPVSVRDRDVACPVCGCGTTRHAKTRRRFRHGYAWGVGTIWIELDIPRQRCGACDLTFVHDYGLGLGHSSTRSFREAIARRCHGRTIADVAREYELPYTTVERWFYLHASKGIEEADARHVLVDEFATRKGHHYATAVLDAESGRLLSIVPGRDESAVTAALASVPGTVMTVVSDFAPAMANAIARVFPDADHVLDRFHLVQFFTEALRRRRRFLDDTKRQYHVRSIDRSLARRPEELTAEGHEIVRACLAEDRVTREVYRGLQHIRYVLKASSDVQARRRLSDWLSRYRFHPCGPLAKIAKTIQAREKAVQRTVLSRLSNGKMEGTNNKIKLIKRRAYGYRNLDRFFLRLRLEIGRTSVNHGLW